MLIDIGLGVASKGRIPKGLLHGSKRLLAGHWGQQILDFNTVQRLHLQGAERFLSSFDRPYIFYRIVPKEQPRKQLLGFLAGCGFAPSSRLPFVKRLA